jgi:predicted O-linked N-acetylglucosamine transferase (SPINDLY family)
LSRLGRHEAALERFERALSVRPDDDEAHLRRAQALESLGRYREALASLETRLARLPGDPAVIAAMVSCAYRICDWDRVKAGLAGLKSLPDGLRALHPFLLLACELSHSELAQALRDQGVRSQQPPRVARRLERGVDRLRIAYVSPDFRDHPVAHCLAGVIERHDRGSVCAIGVSVSAPDTSAVGKRLRASFDEFIDAAALSDLQVARLLQERGVDIAIDLAGHTLGSRPGIFAARAAPVQISYLGFPGTTGHEFMDYILADGTVITEQDEPFFRERVLRLPHCYLPFDDTRPEPGHCTRAEAGLPPAGFVFCAFNNAYKISGEMFRVWLDLLHEVPGSLLWLRNMGEGALAHLKDAARTANVAPDRLIVAPYIADAGAHIARLRLADVFLDTLPYNAHSSAAEAIWAGVPLISCCGDTFAGRVSASIAKAAGAPELITKDLDGYRSRALELATAPGTLSQLRQRLDADRRTTPLFDTARYTRNLEELLFQAHAEVLARAE